MPEAQPSSALMLALRNLQRKNPGTLGPRAQACEMYCPLLALGDLLGVC